ncbi:MAG: hypothetical protein Q8L49_16040 [Burkholderiaceae bacterium]|nr:hypothetical protein [Burkholderiaceae bacterium]
MGSFRGEIIKDDRGREVVRFTTPSGVRAVVATSITMSALQKMVRNLERKLKRAGHLPGAKGKHGDAP